MFPCVDPLPLFARLSVEGHVACVPALILADDVAVSVECGRLFQALILRNSNTPQRGISGSCGSSVLVFLRNPVLSSLCCLVKRLPWSGVGSLRAPRLRASRRWPLSSSSVWPCWECVPDPGQTGIWDVCPPMSKREGGLGQAQGAAKVPPGSRDWFCCWLPLCGSITILKSHSKKSPFK